MKKFHLILLITSLCFAKVWADDEPVSTQKTLPNGDMQSQVLASKNLGD